MVYGGDWSEVGRNLVVDDRVRLSRQREAFISVSGFSTCPVAVSLSVRCAAAARLGGGRVCFFLSIKLVNKVCNKRSFHHDQRPRGRYGLYKNTRYCPQGRSRHESCKPKAIFILFTPSFVPPISASEVNSTLCRNEALSHYPHLVLALPQSRQPFGRARQPGTPRESMQTLSRNGQGQLPRVRQYL